MSGALDPSNRFHHAAAGASHFAAAAPDSAFLELTSELAYDFGLGFHHRHHQHQPPPGFGYHLSSTEASLAWEAQTAFASYHQGHQAHFVGASSHCDFGPFSLSTSRLHTGGSMGVQRQCQPRTSPCSVASSKATKTRRRVATIAQRRAANIRERRRMFNLNSAFDKLRKKVPTFAYEKRLSRIETLRLAIMYIAFMTEVIRGGDPTYDAPPQIWTAAPQASAPSDAPIQSRSDRLAHICSRHV